MQKFYKIAMLVCLMHVNAGDVWAQIPPKPPALPEPVTFYGQYSFSWAGLRLGKLALGMDETKDSYKLYLSVTSAGIVNLFTHHTNSTEAHGKRSKDAYHPEFYESFYKTKKKPRQIRLQYDAKGNVTEVFNEPPEDRAKRPEVPAETSKGSYDPLTGMMAIRAGVYSLKAFDVKRFYEVTAESKGMETMSILGKDVEAEQLVLSRKPVAGMTEKEMKEYEAGEPPLSFYFSNDARRVPVLMTLPIMLGSVKGLLTKECATWDECKVN